MFVVVFLLYRWSPYGFLLLQRCWFVVIGGVEKHLVEQGAGSRGYVSKETAIEAVVAIEESIRSMLVAAAVVVIGGGGCGGSVSYTCMRHCWLLWYRGHCR